MERRKRRVKQINELSNFWICVQLEFSSFFEVAPHRIRTIIATLCDALH